jgi:hypothetical protein
MNQQPPIIPLQQNQYLTNQTPGHIALQQNQQTMPLFNKPPNTINGSNNKQPTSHLGSNDTSNNNSNMETTEREMVRRARVSRHFCNK